jgi:hypothetical protein
MKLNKKISQLLSLVLTGLLLIFAYNYISDLVQQADSEDFTVHWLFLSLSAILFITSYGFFSLNWLFSARIMQSAASNRQALVFFASQPYKYLPTSLFIFSSRAIYGKRLGLTLRQASISQVFENLSLFMANFVLFAALYVANVNIIYGLLTTFATTIALVVLHNRQIIHLKLGGREFTIVTSHIVRLYLMSTLGWLFCGLAFVALNAALGLSINFLNILAANTIAFSLSMLVIFAPGGIGIREVVYGFFTVSAAAIIYWRILVFIIDILLGMVAIAIIKTKPHLISKSYFSEN